MIDRWPEPNRCKSRLFVMTLTIQLFVYPDAFLSTHFGWFALALAIIARGPGRVSLDHLIGTKLGQQSRA